MAHQQKQPDASNILIEEDKWDDETKLGRKQSEGIYTFMPEWFNQAPSQYSQLNDDITYQSGQLVEQWSIFFKNCTTNEKAIMRVRFSPIWDDLIEFELETAPVPIEDGQGKDITINWKLFDSFDPNGTFYTDSNGLEMQTR